MVAANPNFAKVLAVKRRFARCYAPLRLRPTPKTIAPHLGRVSAVALRRSVVQLLDGHDLELLGNVAANIMADVIMALCPSRDVAEIDRTIDELAAALKAGCRAQLERDKRETFQ